MLKSKLYNKIVFIVIGSTLGLIFGQSAYGNSAKKSSDVISSLQPYNFSTNLFDVSLIYTRDKKIVPVVVIGSGPAGCGAALYASQGRLKTVLITGDEPGGLLMKTKHVDNWPGVKLASGESIINNLHEQAKNATVEFVDDTVESVDFSSWPYVIRTEDDLTIHALAVVIATGASPRKLGIPGEQEYWGNGVSSCAVCDAGFYSKKDTVIVVGGGDSAATEAMELAGHAGSVTILVRKPHMRASKNLQKRMKEYDNITVRYNTELHEIRGKQTFNDDGELETQKVTSALLFNNKTKKTTELPIQGVFLAIGHNPNSTLFKNYVACTDSGYIKKVIGRQMTSLPGVYVAGEIADDHYRQAASSFDDGLKAGLDAREFFLDIGFNDKVAARLGISFDVGSKSSDHTMALPEAI